MQNAMSAAIVATSNDAISSYSLDGIITSWNLGAERLYGYSTDEMIGHSFSILVPFEKAAEADDLQQRIRNCQPILNYETVWLKKDGSAVPVSMNISPMHDLTGAVIGASSITRDLSERNETEQKFRATVNSAPNAIVIVDKTGAITFANPQTEKIFGYHRDEMLGQPVELLIPSRFHANHSSLRDGYLAHPHIRPMGPVEGGADLYGRRKDGHEFPADISLNPIETTDKHASVVAIIRDATEQRKIVRRLYDLNELRNGFVVTVAHDLRAPMNSISGFAHELINEWDATDDTKKIEYLQIIVRNTEHLAKFVEDVFQVARIESGEFAYYIRPFDIHSLVQRTLDDTASASEGRRFEFSAPGDFPTVLGDEDRLWQVLTNLLSNAVKFSPADEPVVVGLSCIDDFVHVSVTDRGIGIATDDISKLFSKFGRVSTPGARKIPGNGLGLYICKTLVDAHGGQIWCESSPGRGSTFIFTIPVAR